ncbi:MAG: heat-inducible transcriptional repressor HrcA [Candidatus Cloacimonadaceae bacterium]|nr:heat-inducible transcriptional repressor HrcA [Candidatus Cloacimonadaceae bacterium]MDP3113547.1 heat-inducible transcriptional repressor HrcA [Candidatus Cloacimonadaceae bacterium]
MKKNQLRLNETLAALVDEYISSVEPVSSRILNEKYLRDVSSATLRLDLMKLEQLNLIFQPHTSAGRMPTLGGYRAYMALIEPDHENVRYERMEVLRELIIHNYKDTPRALHYIMQMLAKETDQLSFVAEPEVSNGYLAKLEVFSIGGHKYLFVVSLDSGLDKTVMMKCDYEISDTQLRKLVRYLNDELAGLRVYDIANKVLVEMRENLHEDNNLVSMFLRELHKAFIEISDFFIHFDGSIRFLEQPEFDSKENILSFMNLIQRQDYLLNLMRLKEGTKPVNVLMGEDFNEGAWTSFCLIYGKYEVFGIPGYLGVIAPVRTDYRKLIPLVRDITQTITQTTRRGMMVPK